MNAHNRDVLLHGLNNIIHCADAPDCCRESAKALKEIVLRDDQ